MNNNILDKPSKNTNEEAGTGASPATTGAQYNL